MEFKAKIQDDYIYLINDKLEIIAHLPLKNSSTIENIPTLPNLDNIYYSKKDMEFMFEMGYRKNSMVQTSFEQALEFLIQDKIENGKSLYFICEVFTGVDSEKLLDGITQLKKHPKCKVIKEDKLQWIGHWVFKQ